MLDLFLAILIFIPVIFIYRIYRNIRKHTRGMGLGFRVASAGDPTRDNRVDSYVRGSSADLRRKERKLKRKARKAVNRARTSKKGSTKRQRKQVVAWYKTKKMVDQDEKFARSNVKPGDRLTQGIRRSHNERGYRG